MSDPTARRGDNITAMLDAMKKSAAGWSKGQMKRFLFERYRYGVREQTLDMIINQLKDHGLIYAKPIRKGANVYRWFAEKNPAPPVQ